MEKTRDLKRPMSASWVSTIRIQHLSRVSIFGFEKRETSSNLKGRSENGVRS